MGIKSKRIICPEYTEKKIRRWAEHWGIPVTTGFYLREKLIDGYGFKVKRQQGNKKKNAWVIEFE